jgi:LemA protein
MKIVLIVIIIVSIIASILTILSNKYQLTIIKIDKAEEDIDLYLDKKKQLLSRTVPIIKKELKVKEALVDLDKCSEDLNNFEKHNLLKGIYNEFFKTIDENDKLLKSDSLIKILDELNDNEEDIVGAIKFYNDSVVEFNQLVVSFPSNIIALFKRYKKLEFYTNEKREIFEILNEK